MTKHIHIHIGSKTKDAIDKADDNNQLVRLRKEYEQVVKRGNELRRQLAIVRDVSWTESLKFPEGTSVRAKTNIPEGSSFVKPGRVGKSSGVIIRGALSVDFNGMTKYIPERYLEKV